MQQGCASGKGSRQAFTAGAAFGHVQHACSLCIWLVCKHCRNLLNKYTEKLSLISYTAC